MIQYPLWKRTELGGSRKEKETKLRWQSGLKMTKDVIFSELQNTGTNVFLMDQGTFSENLK